MRETLLIWLPSWLRGTVHRGSLETVEKPSGTYRRNRPSRGAQTRRIQDKLTPSYSRSEDIANEVLCYKCKIHVRMSNTSNPPIHCITIKCRYTETDFDLIMKQLKASTHCTAQSLATSKFVNCQHAGVEICTVG